LKKLYYSQRLKKIEKAVLIPLFSTARKKYNKTINKDFSNNSVELKLGTALCKSITNNYKINLENHLKSKDVFKKPTFRRKDTEFFIAFFGVDMFAINEDEGTCELYAGSFGTISFPIAKDFFKLRSYSKKQIKMVRLHRDRFGFFVVYEYVEQNATQPKNYQGIYSAGVDLGADVLIAAYVDSPDPSHRPLLIKGGLLKNTNYYYLKNPKDKELEFWRSNKTKEIMTYAVKRLFDWAIFCNVKELIIGDFHGVKRKKCAIQFSLISYYFLNKKIKDYAQKTGIKVLFLSEAYTSQCSFLDYERICPENANKARRVERGLFISNNGIKIHADLNGAGNTLSAHRPILYDRNAILRKPYVINLTKCNKGKR